ncbi:UDP-N-acetylglucosamine 2-epimerase [Pontibacter sp. E15-1]|uniref:UDP-N-acetylglucosamine 2-epimerase n=1 Tax=Pontibacter sp. E15-1 TaxID=2919918 RepID=UPI001F503170|nr:UDP-N-acetylglucosamine 2-epimerase [Pontibacter sp. E15-1]MCJ8166416.1 UDP-N-acetylglucosamine 2-epimerase [Pontibacter sp. E15-1]
MRIAVLTSSRADYGIYLPLLNKLQADAYFDLRLLVFGSHLSKFHGYTAIQIEKDGFQIDHHVETVLSADSKEAISTSMALTSLKFAAIWAQEEDRYDYVLCLGDRYEMFSAVSAAAPFHVKLAHLHGGETTLGAIDNQFRHSISLFSTLHFTSTEAAAQRVSAITEDTDNVYCVGALSLDNLATVPLLTLDEFQRKFGIDLSIPSVLFTFHPETVNPQHNSLHISEIVAVLERLEYQVIVTLPNADTSGNTIRQKLLECADTSRQIKVVENFGTQGYFTCLKHCAFLLGNTSSGILEAASFGKYVVDLGSRQAGREHGPNVLKCRISQTEILSTVNRIPSLPPLDHTNIYWQGGAADKIIRVLKTI